MEQLIWESVDQNGTGQIFRAKLPGGWLVRWAENNVSIPGALCFVPDKLHKWGTGEPSSSAPKPEDLPGLTIEEDDLFYTGGPDYDY